MYDDEVWTLSQGGTRLRAGQFMYAGTQENCISTFVQDFQGTRGEWLFNFQLEEPAVVFTLDRQMDGVHCILSWERILERQ